MIVGTFGKAAASSGAFAAVSSELKNFFNKQGSQFYIFDSFISDDFGMDSFYGGKFDKDGYRKIACG